MASDAGAEQDMSVHPDTQAGLKKYASVSPTAFGLVGKKRLAVIRAAGAIVGGSGGSP